jgi:hypothetical protein
MHTVCLSTSTIPPISENHRRLMQYAHKDVQQSNASTPTTPLGTLTHKTPPQHTLAENLWTTSDLHVMSIVLGPLDTPYVAYFLSWTFFGNPVSTWYTIPISSSTLHITAMQVTTGLVLLPCQYFPVQYAVFRHCFWPPCLFSATG